MVARVQDSFFACLSPVFRGLARALPASVSLRLNGLTLHEKGAHEKRKYRGYEKGKKADAKSAQSKMGTNKKPEVKRKSF